MKFSLWPALAAGLCLSQSAVRAQNQAPVSSLGGGSLSGLMMPRAGKIAHYSSFDRTSGNDDFLRVAPGETVTLVNHQGAGVVRRWWLTMGPWNNVELQRQGIIRCYWDGETSPSVEVPVADFFGMGFGQWRQYISLPMSMTSGGFNCYWPMPFHRSARITFENRSRRPVDSFYFNVDVESAPDLPRDALYFHAQFRKAVSRRGEPIAILEATGRGHYVGTLLSIRSRTPRNEMFLEGDERVWVDDEQTPSINGTGTEDYFNSGWYFNGGTYSAPYHGVTMVSNPDGCINAYRWHIEDPIPFARSLRFSIEHGTHNDTPGVDYSSVAYWYQTHPHAPFPPLPDDLLPSPVLPLFQIAGLIEGESLVATAKISAGEIEAQDMVFKGQWSGQSQLFWKEGQVGDTLRLKLNAPATRTFELVGFFTRAEDYGDFGVKVNGQKVGPLLKGYSETVMPTGAVSLGRVALRAGSNDLQISIQGKNPLSTGYYVGVDGFMLKPL